MMGECRYLSGHAIAISAIGEAYISVSVRDFYPRYQFEGNP